MKVRGKSHIFVNRGETDVERKPDYLKITESPDWVRLKVLSAWCSASDTHLEMLESEVNMVVARDHISPMGLTSNVFGSFCVVYFGSPAYCFVYALC